MSTPADPARVAPRPQARAMHAAMSLSGHIEIITFLKTWRGQRCGLEYIPVLVYSEDRRWYVGLFLLDGSGGFDTPPGCPTRVEFHEIAASRALLWFKREDIEFPPEMLESYETSRRQAPPPEKPDEKPSTNNQRVADLLDQNPTYKSLAIAEKLGIPETSVRGTHAWKERSKGRRADVGSRERAGRIGGGHKEVQLTEKMLAARPGPSKDPSELASDDEILERTYLERCTAQERAEYHRMEPDERTNTIWAWNAERGSNS